MQRDIKDFFLSCPSESMPPKASSKTDKAAPKPAKRRRVTPNRFCDLEAEESGDEGGLCGDICSEDDHETAEDRALIDDSKRGAKDRVKRERVRVTESEKKLCKDDFLLLRDFCVSSGLAPGDDSPDSSRKGGRDKKSKGKKGRKSRGYADADDLDNQNSSDEDFVSDSCDGSGSEGEEECDGALEADVGKKISAYVAGQGIVVNPRNAARPASKSEARKKAFANTMAFLTANKVQTKQATGGGPRVACKVQTSPRSVQLSSKAVAPVFSPRAWSKKQEGSPGKKAEGKPGQKHFAGLVVNPITKAVNYRDGRGNVRPFEGPI